MSASSTPSTAIPPAGVAATAAVAVATAATTSTATATTTATITTMVSESSASSNRVSLISLDPAVASQITAPTTTRGTTLPSDSQAGSSPRKTVLTPDVERRHVRNISAPSTMAEKRSTSLRRVKNSTEVLRQRSTKTAKKAKAAETSRSSDTRGGRNFTIGNVGTGGLLYLTPSAHQIPIARTLVSPLAAAPRPNASVLLTDGETAIPTLQAHRNGSPLSQPRTAATPKTSMQSSRQSRRTRVSHHARSQSFSTVEDHRHSLQAAKSRTLRIVINRPDLSRPNTSEDIGEERHRDFLPTLEVPIPHYRMGSFRINSAGHPMLRGSVAYTQTSATPSELTPPATAAPGGYFHAGPPPMASRKAFAKLETSQAEAVDELRPPQIQFPPTPKSSSTSIPTPTSPIEPELFDELARIYDDPGVVRYCQNVREITAATPARIIAQISSDSFMDYELVSDFFLTFRSYMSPLSALDYLLARLRWAIGRMEDDGRIIRVRTFAALRHWILNYFMDDFFPDIRLRLRFCAEINALHADVKSSLGHGFSDLKLLRDLKRCWNGRCTLCWPGEGFELDGDQEADIVPGGYPVLPPTVEDEPAFEPPASHDLDAPGPEVVRGPTNSWFEFEPASKTVHSQSQTHSRQKSAQSEKVPDSLLSDGSLQANSCFVVTKAMLRPNGGESDAVHARAPHPVSVQLRRKNAPSNLQVNTQPAALAPKSLGHRRGAGSIDSNREPTSYAPAEADILPEDGNIIRGLLYSPSAPFVQVAPPVTKSSTQSLDRAETRTTVRREHASQPQQHGRNIFGSLRKVLGSRPPGHVDAALSEGSNSSHNVSTRGTRSQMPLNVSRSHDELRDKLAATMSHKGEIRIDLLCAAVCQSYENKFPTKHRITYSGFYASQAPPPPEVAQPNALAAPHRTERMGSRATAQSGSILIVDDTGIDAPSMSGALQYPSQTSNLDDPDYVPYVMIPGPGDQRNSSFDAVATQRSSNVFGKGSNPGSSANKSNEMLQPNDAKSTRSGRPSSDLVSRDELLQHVGPLRTGSTSTIRNEVGSHGQELITDPAPETASVAEENPPEDKQQLPHQPLRRRPGGDLRRAENVHQLDHAHHDSLDTISAATDSPHESLLIMKTESKARRKSAEEAAPPQKKVVSMINTHSSQHLRPSFEAAIAGFSAIPDDDDGGLEATLMKLEGRYEKQSPPLEQHPLDTTNRRHSLPEFALRQQMPNESLVMAMRQTETPVREVQHSVEEVVDADSLLEVPREPRGGENGHGSRRSSIFGLPTESVVDSEESFNVVPILQRDNAHESTAQPAAPGFYGLDQPGYYAQDPPQLFHLPKGPPRRPANRDSLRPSTANDSARSFLLDEDENLSDLSSEISVDIINYSEVVDRSISPMLAAPGTAISGLEIPAHPLTYASVVNLQVPEVTARASDPTPHTKPESRQLLSPAQPSSRSQTSSAAYQPLGRLPSGPAHIPFVLAVDSQILAQQMTLVEKSALCEVEWFDLVEMRWNNKAAEVLDWVDCLINPKIKGIDLIITRFNLVVKWALSEIVLTHDVEERARVVTKFIHVAAHARRLHNYATMLQLTIALTSTDCTKLTKTWALVSGPDKSLLKHMEALVQPIRNFHDLRLEMETADLSDGCIPFIGLYVHDLTYNAQKPSKVPGGRDGETLINFERYRTAAVIVKGLLRLIDASSRYAFEPLPGVIERCLWMAALSDDRIRGASTALEA